MTAKSITHSFVSGVSDGGDASLVRPSNWNADHVFRLGRRTVTGSTDTIAHADELCQLLYNRSSAIAVTLNQPTGGNFPLGWMTYVRNIGAGTVTITPTSSTINQGSSLAVLTGESVIIMSDGTNFDANLIGLPLRSYAGQIPGTTTNDSASAGNVGEHTTASVASSSPTGLTTATAVSLITLSLTAGDWDVSSMVGFSGTATSVGLIGCHLTTTLNQALQVDDESTMIIPGAAFSVVSNPTIKAGPKRFSLSGTTNVYVNVMATFSGGTCSGYGKMRARRMR